MPDYINRSDVLDKCGWYNLADGKHSIHAAQAWEIASIPAADVVEVRRGEWITVGRLEGEVTKACSICNHGARERMVLVYNYCPNCGAKMDGGADNDHT